MKPANRHYHDEDHDPPVTLLLRGECLRPYPEIPAETLRAIEEWEKRSRFFLKYGRQPEVEVTEDEWIEAEQNAGFRPTGPWRRATDGFSGHGIAGRIEHD